MKLVFAVVQGKDAESLTDALRASGYRFTQVNSAGGFLRDHNITIMVGVEDAEIPEVMRVVKQNCYSRTHYVNPLLPIIEPGEFYVPNPVEVQVGGATVFVLNVRHFERMG